MLKDVTSQWNEQVVKWDGWASNETSMCSSTQSAMNKTLKHMEVSSPEDLPGKIDETKYKYQLQKNDEFDLIKIGISRDDNAVYVRADIFKAATTATLLTRIIKQVANVTNIVNGDLK